MLPQLDPTYFISQIFWLAVSFAILYLIVSRLALPTIREVLQDRQSKISSDLEKAEAMKTEAESAKDDYVFGLEEARKKASTLLNEATQEINNEANAKNTELDAVIEKKLAAADAKIAELRADAVEKVKPISADLVSSIVKKVINIDVSEKEIIEVIEKTLQEPKNA